MRILADLHHGQLYQSHELLFEKRLGHELLRPIGRDWYDKCKYWGWIDKEDTINQYMGHPNLLIQGNGNGLDNKGIGRLPGLRQMYHHMMITYDMFMSMHFDILICSVPLHAPVFLKLSQEHFSHPKVIFQMGNNWFDYPKDVNNIMNATNIVIDSNIHSINYIPEFDLKHFIRDIPYVNKSISSFLHINGSHYRDMFMELEKLLGWNFKEYGTLNRDGSIDDTGEKISDAILNSQFIWHVKRSGEGYGFIIHEAFASGRPPLVNFKDTYHWQRAGLFMKPGINCIDVCDKSVSQIGQEVIDSYNKWEEMSMEAKKSFNDLVDFESQGEDIKKFLSELV